MIVDGMENAFALIVLAGSFLTALAGFAIGYVFGKNRN